MCGAQTPPSLSPPLLVDKSSVDDLTRLNIRSQCFVKQNNFTRKLRLHPDATSRPDASSAPSTA
ncbi:unnamed protein product [Camellia sinensis]